MVPTGTSALQEKPYGTLIFKGVKQVATESCWARDLPLLTSLCVQCSPIAVIV